MKIALEEHDSTRRERGVTLRHGVINTFKTFCVARIDRLTMILTFFPDLFLLHFLYFKRRSFALPPWHHFRMHRNSGSARAHTSCDTLYKLVHPDCLAGRILRVTLPLKWTKGFLMWTRVNIHTMCFQTTAIFRDNYA